MELNPEQKEFLNALSLRLGTVVLQGAEQVRLLHEMLHSGYLCSVYEESTGKYLARITPEGRKALR